MKKLKIILAIAAFCFCSMIMVYTGNGEIKGAYHNVTGSVKPFQSAGYSNLSTHDRNPSKLAVDNTVKPDKILSARTDKLKVKEKIEYNAMTSGSNTVSHKKLSRKKNNLLALLLLAQGGAR